MRGRWEVVKKTKRKGSKKEGRGALIRTARTCRRGETIRFVMRGSSVTKRAWDVSGWARMREMRKAEGARCSFRIPHMHCYTHLFVMFWSPNMCTPQIFWINLPAQRHFQCARMHIMFTPSNIDRDTHTVSEEEEAVQSAPGSPRCTHIHHSVADLTGPSALQAMDSHMHIHLHF